MDFEFHLTPELEAFQEEVREFLREHGNMPPDLGPTPIESEDLTREMFEWSFQFRLKLGERGWIYPTWPTEVGGGGLSAEHDRVLSDELERAGLPHVYDTNRLAAPALYVWGTDEQKQRFLTPLLRGEKRAWQLFTEPDVGSDLAAVKTTAILDGDSFVITGTKQFIGGEFGPPDYFWCVAVTDPDSPRHRNLGAFLFPANLPGITIQPMELLVRHSKNIIYMDRVRVSREYLVGGDTQGWQVINSTLEVEHGAGGSISTRDPLTEGLTHHLREKGGIQGEARRSLVDLHIASKARGLIALRTYWMSDSGQTMSYEGSQNSLMGKMHTWRGGLQALTIAGPYALLNDKEFGPLGGQLEHWQRQSESTHAGGSPEIQKVVIARRIGLSRTKERPAATHQNT